MIQKNTVTRLDLINAFQQADWLTAETVAKQLVDQCESQYGKQGEQYWVAITEYAEVFKNQKSDQKALDAYLSILELTDQVYPGKQQAAGTYNNIAMCYYNLFQHGNSVPYFMKALEIWEKQFPQDHQYVQLTKNNIQVNTMMAQFDNQSQGAKQIIKMDFTRGLDGRKPEEQEEKTNSQEEKEKDNEQ